VGLTDNDGRTRQRSTIPDWLGVYVLLYVCVTNTAELGDVLFLHTQSNPIELVNYVPLTIPMLTLNCAENRDC